MKCVFVLGFAASVSLFSCSSGTKEEEGHASVANAAPAKDSLLPKGTVIGKIACRADSSLSYALYLPSKYNIREKFPVIFFFDPHGAGTLPLEAYKGLAEKYGYILAGSNNSRNGMGWEPNRAQIRVFMEDAKNRLSIDTRRICAGGFSGGSRVASSLAIFEGGIYCVIGMGAGFPALSEPISHGFYYIGFAGNEDFNMYEMIQLNTSLDQSPIRHQLINFDGKHEWAPAAAAEEAFVWIELNSMKDKLIPRNETMIKEYMAAAEVELNNPGHAMGTYEVFRHAKKIVNFFNGLADVTPFLNKGNEIAGSEEIKKIMEQKEKAAAQEMALQETYRNNFVLKDVEWWKQEIARLNKIGVLRSAEEYHMRKRMLGYLGLLAYMNSSSAIAQLSAAGASGNPEMAEKSLKIYEMAEPENIEQQYMFAELYAAKKQNEKVIAYLKKAAQNGFNDTARIMADPFFADFRKAPEYGQVIEAIKKGKPV